MKILKLIAKLKFLIPNIFTLLSIYFAYLAFLSDDVVDRCWFVLLCVIMDKLDGTSARLLRATTKFGLKFDSVADAIAFGVLPGLIIFQGASLVPESMANSMAWIYLFKFSGVVYILATFWRLYKFDKLAASDSSPLCFFGIPSTLAAAIFAAYCVAFGPYFEAQIGLVFLLPLWGLVLSVLMNGNFPTLKVGIPEKKSLRLLQALGFIYLGIAIPTRQTAPGLFILAVLVLFITIYYGRRNFKRRDQEEPAKEINGA